MEKTKEQPKIQENGKQEKLTKEEMIKRLEKDAELLKIQYHERTFALLCLKEIK